MQKNEADGSSEYTPENYQRYLDRIMNMPDYRVVGVRHWLSLIKDKLRDYRLNHLKIGKLVQSTQMGEKDSFRVKNISWDIHWQMDRMLSILIRDYLRFFINETPAIGNCVIKDNPEGLSYDEAINTKDIDFAERWRKVVNNAADEFDTLRLMIESDSSQGSSYEMIHDQTKKALESLAYIFNDLNW